MKKLFCYFIVICFLSCQFLIAQQKGPEKQDSTKNSPRMDYLLKELEKIKNDDSSKVDLLTKIAFEIHSSNPVEGIDYAQKALDLSEKLHYTAQLSELNKILAVSSLLKGDYAKFLEYMHKSITTGTSGPSSNWVKLNLVNIGNLNFYTKARPDEFDKFYKTIKIENDTTEKSAVILNICNFGNINFGLKQK
jgi:hypothetical protein